MQRFEDIEKNNGSQSLYEVADSVGIPQNRSDFLPGRFYALKTISPVPVLNEQTVPFLNNNRPYYDLNPTGLVLFHENFKETVLILNLKTMPSAASAKFLEAYYKFSAQNGMDRLFKEGKLIPLEERRLLDQRFYFYSPTILSTIIGVSNLDYAINKYNMDQIADAKLIDWDNFGKLVNPRIDQRGMFPDNLNLASVYEEFITNSIS